MSSRLEQFRANNGYARWSGRTERPLFVLAVLFLALLLVPRVWALSHSEVLLLEAGNILIWAAFALDYVARLYLARHRWWFVRTHVLDLLIVALPLLRPLRVFAMLRVVSVAAIANKHASASLHGRILTYVAVTAGMAVVLAGVAIRDVERNAPGANIHSFGDGLWWAAATVTAVGYGDLYPVTTLGRVIAIALMLVGIALLGVITASIAAWFVQRLRGVSDEIESSEERTDRAIHAVLEEVRALRAEVAELKGEAPD